jgi:signal peptidase II
MPPKAVFVPPGMVATIYGRHVNSRGQSQAAEVFLLATRHSSLAAHSRWVLPAVVFCSCLGCDQWTKMLATEHLKQVPPAQFLGDTLRIQYAENPGAFLGAGGGLPAQQRFWLLVVLNAVVLIAIPVVVAAKCNLGRAQMLAVSLLLAGGIGNLLDRVFHGGLVVDFLNMGIGPLRTGIFNVADMAIMGGFALLILQRNPQTRTPDEPAAELSGGSESQ